MEDKFKLQREFYDRPTLLGKDQIENPLRVLECYFNSLPLHDIRSDLARLLECALTSDCVHFAEPEQRKSIVNAVQELEIALEAAYLVSFKKK